jgi:hypothetical protein
MYSVDVRIGPKQRQIGFLGNIVYFGSVYLFFQAPDNGSGEYNISDRAKSYDKILDQLVID